MLLSENIYFLILFTLPAAFNIIYNTYIRRVPRSYKDKSVELSECVIFCLAVFFGNILVLKKEVILFARYILLENEEVAEFISKTKFDYIDFMMQYFIVNMIMSVVMIMLWNLILKKIYLVITNIINKSFGRPEETGFSDVWRNLFETNELLNVYDHAVKIEKGGQLITAGIIAMNQAPNEDEKEIVVYNTEHIIELFEEDKKKKYKKRILGDSVYEYYNIQNDILIKFYSLEKYDKIYGK